MSDNENHNLTIGLAQFLRTRHTLYIKPLALALIQKGIVLRPTEPSSPKILTNFKRELKAVKFIKQSLAAGLFKCQRCMIYKPLLFWSPRKRWLMSS